MIKSLLKSALISLSLTLLISNNSLAVEYEDISENTIVQNFIGNEKERATAVTKLTTGGYLVGGSTKSTNIPGIINKGGYDGLIIKYDDNNKVQWSRSVGGSLDDDIVSIIETSDGNIVAIGDSRSIDMPYANMGSEDGFIVKYDMNGNQLFIKNFGGSGEDDATNIVEGPDGDFYISGYSDSPEFGILNTSEANATIYSVDKFGDFKWAKHFGGSSKDMFNSLQILSDNTILAVGSSGSIDAGYINGGYYDAIAVKFDLNGNQLNYMTISGNGVEELEESIELSDGSIIMVGDSASTNLTFSNGGGEDIIVAKYDSDLNMQWIKGFGGNLDDDSESVTRNSDDSFILVGDSRSTDLGFKNKGKRDGLMIHFDKNGEAITVKSFGGADIDYLNKVIQREDGNFMLVGYSYSTDMSFNNSGSSDILIIEYDAIWKNVAQAVSDAEKNPSDESLLAIARELANKMPETYKKDIFQDRLNAISDKEMELLKATSNLDVYIKSENMLSLSLDTNSVSFDDFSGVEDIEKQNAVNLTVNSSLPYTVKVYLASEIQNADKSKIMDKSMLNIKANSESTYEAFSDTVTPIVLLDNQVEGNNISHGVDLKLKGGIAHEKDVYKTTIKLEVNQK